MHPRAVAGGVFFPVGGGGYRLGNWWMPVRSASRLFALDQAFLLGIDRRLRAIGQVQLATDIADVPLGGPEADHELVGADELEHIQLAFSHISEARLATARQGI